MDGGRVSKGHALPIYQVMEIRRSSRIKSVINR